MKMRKTYIGGSGSTRPWTRRDKGAAVREGSFCLREAHGRPNHILKKEITAMRPSMPREDHRPLVDLLAQGVIHLRVKRLERRGVPLQVLLGIAIVLRKLGLRLR